MRRVQIAIGAIALLALFLWAASSLLFQKPSSRGEERNGSASLKTLATAQADFRANDRDHNGKQDYWRKDVAGLYALIPRGGTEADAIKLIEISIAAADDRPVIDMAKYARRSSKSGYWFRAIRHADERDFDLQRFAFCVFPDSRSVGRWTFIIDEKNTMYKKDLGNSRGIEIYPLDPPKEGWSPMD